MEVVAVSLLKIEKKSIFFVSTMFLLLLSLSSCGFFSALTPAQSSRNSDGPPQEKMDSNKIKDAVPRVEQKSRGGNSESYSVFGKKYRVLSSAKGFSERGEASWYGKKFHGRLTANGERYDMYEMTAAHKNLPLPTYVQVKNLENGRKIIVRVNDRGPFHGGRIIDLSYAAATKIGMLKKGVAKVEITAINAKSWRKQQSAKQQSAKQQPKPLAALAVAKVEAPVVLKDNITRRQIEPRALAADGKAYYLQVGAFKSLLAAQGLQNKVLTELKAETKQMLVVIHPTASEQPIYRVRLGPFASKQTSQQSLSELQQRSLLQSFGKIHTVSE